MLFQYFKNDLNVSIRFNPKNNVSVNIVLFHKSAAAFLVCLEPLAAADEYALVLRMRTVRSTDFRCVRRLKLEVVEA